MRRALLLVIVAAGLACETSGLPTEHRRGPGDDTPDRLLPLTRFRSDTAAYAVFSGLAEAQRGVIGDETTWHALWSQLHGYLSPAPEPPGVDFAEDIVLVAALGTAPSGGYLIRIDSVYQRGARLDVLVRRHRPGPNCVVPAVITAPVDLVRVPRAATLVTFREMEFVLDCS